MSDRLVCKLGTLQARAGRGPLNLSLRGGTVASVLKQQLELTATSTFSCRSQGARRSAFVLIHSATHSAL